MVRWWMGTRTSNAEQVESRYDGMFWSTEWILILAFVPDGVSLLLRLERRVQRGPTRTCLREAPGLLKFPSAKLSNGGVVATSPTRFTCDLATPGVSNDGERAGSHTTGCGKNHPVVCVVGRWEGETVAKPEGSRTLHYSRYVKFRFDGELRSIGLGGDRVKRGVSMTANTIKQRERRM